jgi:hypothetical protein
VTESSETSDTPAKPQDYASLRAELAKLVNDFTPVINELWPPGRPHLPVEIAQLRAAGGIRQTSRRRNHRSAIEALKAIGIADNKLLQAHTKADHHNPSSPDAA